MTFDPNIYRHGGCEYPGCTQGAIFRVRTEKLCKDHKGADVVFAPFLGQQEKFFQRRERVVFFGGAAGGAKAFTLETPIPTPHGWTEIGDIRPGDAVFGEDGLPVRVVAVSEVFTQEDVYRLTFSDGTSIEATENHLWKTTTEAERDASWRRSDEYRAQRRASRPSRANGKNLRPHVAAVNAARLYKYKPAPVSAERRTIEIVETLYSKRGAANHSIAQHGPIVMRFAELPVPPYTLGAWLGDGSSACGEVTGIDQEIFDSIRIDGFDLHPPRKKTITRGVVGLTGMLRTAGVLRNKHIPASYLRASVAQRIALLQGLMDTDGSAAMDGSCKITLSRKELFDGVVELLRTLGIVVNVRAHTAHATNGRPGNASKVWSAVFVTKLPVFRLLRKRTRQKTDPQARYLRRYIVAAENLGPKPSRCIQVENPNGMYIAGEQFIPTHNSRSLWVKYGQQLAIEYARAEAARKKGVRFKSRAWGLYFRRTTPNFRQAFERCEEDFRALDPAAYPDRNTHTWTFPSCGDAVFQFAHMEHPADRFKYKSVEATYIAFDELTEFQEDQYDYMDTRLRTTDPKLEPYLQMCSASNPDGIGVIWVRERFIEPVPPETVMRIETTLADGRVVEYDQIFIPSKLSDNPILMASGTYEASLMNKRPEVREALLNGNWYIAPGAFFGSIWDSMLHVVEDHDIPPGAKLFRSADWGIKSPSSVCWWYEDADGGLTMFAHLRTIGLTVDKVADKMISVESRFDLWDEEAQESRLNMARNPLDSACFGGGQGLTGGRTIAKDFRDAGFRWKSAKKGPGSRVQGLSQMIKRMTTLIPAAFEGATEPTERLRPMLRFMKSCGSPIRTIPVIVTDPGNPDDVDTTADDHDVDACLAPGTLIDTEDGPRRIFDLVGTSGRVRSFDSNLHRYRNCRLTRKQAKTLRLVFADGTDLVCTPDHRILGYDGVWREARDFDTTMYAWKTRSSYLKRSKNGTGSVTTSAGSIFSAAGDVFIERCSRLLMALSRMVSMFITRTRIAATTPSATWHSSTSTSTAGFTDCSPPRQEGIGGSSPRSARAPLGERRNGTPPTKAAHGTAQMLDARPAPAPLRLASSFAKSVADGFCRLTSAFRGGVRISAKRRPAEPAEQTTWRGIAPSAGGRSWPTGTAVPFGARGGAVGLLRVEKGPIRDVYCMTVDGIASFCLANGVTVSNCMYACLEFALDVGKRRAEEDDDDDMPVKSRTIDRMTLGRPVR